MTLSIILSFQINQHQLSLPKIKQLIKLLWVISLTLKTRLINSQQSLKTKRKETVGVVLFLQSLLRVAMLLLALSYRGRSDIIKQWPKLKWLIGSPFQWWYSIICIHYIMGFLFLIYPKDIVRSLFYELAVALVGSSAGMVPWTTCRWA